jgi:hypothetical protein
VKGRWFFGAAALAGLLLTACGDDDGPSGTYSSGADDRGSTSSAAATPAAPKSGAALADNTSATDLPALDPNRKIIFTANLDLSSSDVSRSFGDASALARANGGYVEKSAFSNNKDDASQRSASLTIRVPVQNYDALVTSLRGMNGVSVKDEGSSSSEVTDQYTDLQSRQRNLERTEQQYLELLGRAANVQDILNIQDRLTSVRGQIEQIQGRLKLLDDQTDFATVNVSIEPVALVLKADHGWSMRHVLNESLADSLEVARYLAAAGVVAAVAAAWLVIPVSLGFLATRRLRRHTT